jgi:Ca2+-binding EF-hand superfamily protein
MRTRIATMAAVALALIAMPTIANAQETDQEKPRDEQKSEMFAQLDANGDEVIDLAEFGEFHAWLGEHRQRMIADPASHAIMMEKMAMMREHHGEAIEGQVREPMTKDRPENWKKSMDVTTTDDFEGTYFRLFDRDEDGSVSREEWDASFDVLHPEAQPEVTDVEKSDVEKIDVEKTDAEKTDVEPGMNR